MPREENLQLMSGRRLSVDKSESSELQGAPITGGPHTFVTFSSIQSTPWISEKNRLVL